MSAVDFDIAPLLAIERIVSAMQTNYPTVLQSASIALTGLPLPAPADGSYYPVLEADDAVVREQAEEVAVYVWQAQPQVTGAFESTNISVGPSTSSEWVEAVISIMVGFRFRNFEDIMYMGKTLTANDVMVQRAHRYLGAVKKTVFQYACGANGLTKPQVVDDYLPQAIYDEQQQIVRAYGTVTFSVLQLVNRVLPN